ncbi:T9SS type A sorting domain-containing protein [Kordia jejudonensis]|uniref:T9SS type A sorting domain-containing protein n=1 Tax=Kordia jejudonensis TaxID=1348245 RepID=UPI0006299EBB|nr:T9SS type A sorting domain-containing protein [Kordia jejudonensis]
MKKITLTTFLLFLWSVSCFAQDTEAPTKPTDVTIDYQIGYLSWTSSTDNIGVVAYDIYVNDTFRLTINHLANPTNGITLNDLGPFTYGGIYTFKVLAKDAAGNESPFSYYNSFVADDPQDIYIPDQVFMSKIMNGNNNDKAIEILNLSSTIYDLSEFTLKISYDGNTTWDATYTFPANSTLGLSERIRIANSGHTFPFCNLYGAQDINYLNDVITNFDGNDAIGLFHNGVLIDRLGNLGQNATFIEPNKLAYRAFYSDQHTPWTRETPTSYYHICADFMGEEYLLLSTPEVVAKNIVVYPNPVRGNLLLFETKNNQLLHTATIVDMTGKTVLTTAKIINNQLDIQTITRGIYFVKIQSGNQISIHKMIRQ